MVAQWNAINENYKKLDGYKRVAWPPVSEERIIREFTPQPQTQATQQDSYHNQQQQLQSSQTKQQNQQLQQQQQPTSTPAQGPIYNNVPPAQRQSSPYPQQYQQQQKQHYQQQPQQQPTQYTQSQYNRQPSREPVQQTTVPIAYQQTEQPSQTQYGQQQQNNYSPQLAQQQQQQQVQPQYEQAYGNRQPNNARNTTSPYPGWKPIHPPTVKSQPQYHAQSSVVASERNYPTYPQQQYRASSYDHYQPPQQQSQQQQQPLQQSYNQAPYQQQQQQPQQQYRAQNQGPSQQQQQQQQQPSWVQPQQPYQPQQQSQDQPDFQTQQQQYPNKLREQSLPQDYRGGSPGIITLRKEAPISQQPAPVYNSQPAAVSYQGGSNMRGDLKWPPPEYKEAAARENEERRSLALGPVCRPRKVNRDYTNFFAKNALNSCYPSYKVPPGTQHMLF